MTNEKYIIFGADKSGIRCSKLFNYVQTRSVWSDIFLVVCQMENDELFEAVSKALDILAIQAAETGTATEDWITVSIPKLRVGATPGKLRAGRYRKQPGAPQNVHTVCD